MAITRGLPSWKEGNSLKGSRESVLVAAWCSEFVDALAYYTVAVLLPLYLQSHGVEEWIIGQVAGAKSAVEVFIAVSILRQPWINTIGFAVAFRIGIIALLAATTIFVVSPGYLPFVLMARMLMGVSTGMSVLTSYASVASAYPVDARGFALGVLVSARALGAILGAMFGGEMSGKDVHISVPLTVVTCVVALELVANVVLFADPDTPLASEEESDPLVDNPTQAQAVHARKDKADDYWLGFRTLLGDRTMQVCIASEFLLDGLCIVTEATAGIWLKNDLHFTMAQVGYFVAVMATTGALFAGISGEIKTPRGQMSYIGITGFVVIAAGIVLLTFAHSVVFALLTAAALGVGYGLAQGDEVTAASLVCDQKRAQGATQLHVIGLLMLAACLGDYVITAAVSAGVELYSFGPVWRVLAVLYAVFALVVVYFRVLYPAPEIHEEQE